MRAKRSKKYRKIMSSYNLHFSFRPPYQVLCDSNFLRQCHAFHMPVAKSLTNTLHEESKPYITQCSLAKATADHRASTAGGRGSDSSEGDQKKRGSGTNDKGRGDGKPLWLPPPTEVPLRYCKHKDEEGNELGVIDEADCFIDLVSGQAKGNEVPKNKNHYVIATAEPVDEEQEKKKQQKRRSGHSTGDGTLRSRKRGDVDVREAARQVPGVPIVYVKRSVMVLEEMSAVSERLIRGAEKAKFKDGLVGNLRGVKRKRVDEGESDSDDNDDDDDKIESVKGTSTSKSSDSRSQARSGKKAKGPNPLSMRKKKVRSADSHPDQPNGVAETIDIGGNGNDDGTSAGKKKRRKRKHAKNDVGAHEEELGVPSNGVGKDSLIPGPVAVAVDV